MLDRPTIVARQLEQVGPDGVQTMIARKPRVAVEPGKDLKARGGSVNHRHRDRPVERHHRVVGHPLE